MKRMLLLATAIVLFVGIPGLGQNTVRPVTSRTGNLLMNGQPLSQWCDQIGPAGTIPPDPFTIFLGAITATGEFSPYGSFDSIEQEGGVFIADFAIGDCVALMDHTGHHSLSFRFDAGVSQAGAQIDSIDKGPDWASITAYDENDTPIGFFSENVVNNRRQNGSAPYLGLAESDRYGNPFPGIFRIEFVFHVPFAINELSVTAPVCNAPPNLQPPNLQRNSYQYGDVFAAISSASPGGAVEEHRPYGTLVRNLFDGSGAEYMGGMAFDVAGNLYVVNFSGLSGGHTVSKLDKTGRVINSTFLNPPNDGLKYPESIRAVGTLPDLSDLKLYVGGPNYGDPTSCICILEYDISAGSVRKINVAPAGTTKGTDWIDFLTPNIIIYSGEGQEIKAYDLAANTQLPDLITNLAGMHAYELRVGHPSNSCTRYVCPAPDTSGLPFDPYILVADDDRAVLLDPRPWLNASPIGSTPAVVSRTYLLPGIPSAFGLALDPDGRHFWVADWTMPQADVLQVNVCTGTGGYLWGTNSNPLGVAGLAVWGGLGSVW